VRQIDRRAAIPHRAEECVIRTSYLFEDDDSDILMQIRLDATSVI
jgi:hypothetical protein